MAEITITESNFESEVLGSGLPVLVDFWAPWCNPCKMIAPIVEEIADELAGKVTVGKVNVDEEPLLARRYNVLSIPTLIAFRNGEVSGTAMGVQGKEDIVALVLGQKQ